MLTLKLKERIREHSLEEKPDEVCGLILKIGIEYFTYRCENISFHKKEHCILNPEDYIQADKFGEIVGYYHSQEDDAPSLIDNFTSSDHNIYSIIYCWKNDKFFIIEPKLVSYLNRDFKIGTDDCFSLIRNYYKNNLNIKINDYNRDENWYITNPNLIIDNFNKEGFKEVNKDNIKKNDVLFFGWNIKEVVHMGIYLGNDLFIHHPYLGKSVIENLGHIWKNKLMMAIRYETK